MRFACTSLTLLFSTLAAQAAWIWVEGEAASKTNIRKHPWYYGQTKKEQLSGGDFLAHFDKAAAGEAEFRFQAPADGNYTFWLRANPVQSSLRYSLNDTPLTSVDFTKNQTDQVNIAADHAPDLRFLSWTEVGTAALRAGENRIRFVLDSANSHHGAIDCFVFTNEPFQPAGTLKPDQIAERKSQIAAENKGWFAWDPPADTFKPSPIDLRSLNESYAGAHGWIQARGEKFVYEKGGQPVRFWAVNGPPHELTGEALSECARMLAKRGVNLARIHSGVFEEKTGQLKENEISRRHEVIAAMKKEGIYTHLSIYFPLWMKPEAGTGWQEGYDGNKHPFALLYFEPEFQKLYQQWWKTLLTSKGNTGIRLVDEPALMGIELVNEDSFFFWTFNYENVPDAQMRKLEKMFGDWAAKKHGSIEQALTVWKGTRHTRDHAAEGRLGFRPLAVMFNEKSLRDQDTAEFLLQTQKGFYEHSVHFLRSIGYKGLITASNWTTANDDIFGPLEKLSYLAGDFIDRHGYFGCNHKGENAAWSIRNGDTYSDVSALLFENETPGGPKRFSHPVMDPMYNFKPSMISETTWERPNRYRSEAPLFYSVYGALQDSDCIVHFSLDSNRWQVKPRFFMQPWTLMSPSLMGQFPAASLIYRCGLVSTGELMANLPMKISEAVALKGSKLVQQANLDELRKADVSKAAALSSEAGTDPLIHLVGRTNVTIDEKAGTPEVKDLARYIDRNHGTVTSSTGEVKLNYEKGFLLLNAPAAQGASGNLREAGVIELKDLQIVADTDLEHICVVALDGKPLSSASRMLLQVMTEEKTTNFAAEPAGNGVRRISEIGTDPWLYREIKGSLKFTRADAKQLRVTPLDLNGYPAGPSVSAVEIQLRPETVYYFVEAMK